MPLIIADTDGEIVYRSLSVKEKSARDLLAAISSRENKNGVFRIQNRRVLVRDEFVCGKKRLFFMDFDRLGDSDGEDALEWANFLINGAFAGNESKAKISLSEAARIFSEAFAPSLRECGVNISLRVLAKNICVSTCVNALLLSLTFMVRAFCKEGKTVYIGVEEDFGGVRLFVEAEGFDIAFESLSAAMLYEISAINGFLPTFSETADKKSISLMLSAPDISLYGFKNIDSAYLKKVCEVCLEFII